MMDGMAFLSYRTPLTYRQHSALENLNSFIPGRGCDRLLWRISSSRLFTVLSEGGKVRSHVMALWKTRVTPFMKCFFFLWLKNRILTHDNMQRRQLPHIVGCVMCLDNQDCPPETVLHLFFQCPFARRIWMFLSLRVGYSVVTIRDSAMHTFLASVLADKDCWKKWGTLFITATWLLWKERNKRMFRHNSATVSVIAQRIMRETELCVKYC